MTKYLTILLFITILFSSCGTAKETKINLIHADTSYFQRLDTSFIDITLFPKYTNKAGNNAVVPFLLIDTTVPTKDKNGKITGNSKIKMKTNESGSIEFSSESEQIIDSIPKVFQLVQTEIKTVEKQGFFEKLGDGILIFAEIGMIILLIGLILTLFVAIRNYKKNKDFTNSLKG